MISHSQHNTTIRGHVYHETSLDVLERKPHFVAMVERTRATEVGYRIRRAREARGLSQGGLGGLINQSQSAVSAWEKGEREPGRDVVDRIARALATDVRALEFDSLAGDAGLEQLVPVVGRVGADPEGRIIRTAAQAANDSAPLPVGATSKCVAVEVDGHSMGTVIEDGSLIFYENLETPPSDDLFGEKVVVQLAGDSEADDPDVLVKILRRGSKPGLYDLESINGPTLRDVRVRWAAEIIQITPPRQARRLIRRGMA